MMKVKEKIPLQTILDFTFGWREGLWFVLACGHQEGGGVINPWRAKARIGHRTRCYTCALDRRA